MSIEDDILIERFLKNELSDDEKEAFLNRMESDTFFKDQVLLEKQMSMSLDESSWSFVENDTTEGAKSYEALLSTKEFTDLKEVIVATNNKYKNSSGGNSRRWIIYSSAAIIAVFLSVYFLIQSPVSSEELYVEYISLSDLPSLVSRSDDTSDLLKAQQLFEVANYSDALNLFENSAEPTTATLLIYKGITQMQLDKTDAAETTFEALIKSEFLDAEKGYWYKALLFLKQDNVKKSKSQLEDIVSKKYYNHEKANALLKKL